jgi:hypothetical protein
MSAHEQWHISCSTALNARGNKSHQERETDLAHPRLPSLPVANGPGKTREFAEIRTALADLRLLKRLNDKDPGAAQRPG